MLFALLAWCWWVAGGILWAAEAAGKLLALVALWRWWRGHKRDDAAAATRALVVAKLRGQPREGEG